MKFSTPKDGFTHRGSFYGVPVYLDLESGDFVVAGTNVITDFLLNLATLFHNYVVEFGAQVLASVLGQPYEPGFPVWVKEELGNE